MHPRFGLDQEQRNRFYCAENRNGFAPFHFHSQLELYFVDEGEIEVWINDSRAVLCAGEMSVALSYDAHSYRSLGETRSNYIIIPTYLCQEFVRAFRGKQSKTPFLRDPETVGSLRACYDELKRDSSNRIKTIGYIYVMLGILSEKLRFEEADRAMDPELSARLLFYINEHYRGDLSLSVLSSEFGYSESYLSRYFKSCFGIGINRYITVLRLKQAILLMQEDRNSVTYCALESGFNSLRTFYRVFYEEFHCTPKEYIDALRRDALSNPRT